MKNKVRSVFGIMLAVTIVLFYGSSPASAADKKETKEKKNWLDVFSKKTEKNVGQKTPPGILKKSSQAATTTKDKKSWASLLSEKSQDKKKAQAGTEGAGGGGGGGGGKAETNPMALKAPVNPNTLTPANPNALRPVNPNASRPANPNASRPPANPNSREY